MGLGGMAVRFLRMFGGGAGVAFVVMFGRGAVRLGGLFMMFGGFLVMVALHDNSPFVAAPCGQYCRQYRRL